MITGGFGVSVDLETGASRAWYMGPDGVKRWADTGEPVEMVDGLPQSGQYADVGSGSPMKSPEA